MTSDDKDDLWRDFPKDGDGIRGAVCDRGRLPRVLDRAANNDAATLKRFADGQIAPESAVTTDGHAGYNAASLGARPHEGIVQTKAERASNDVVQACHWSLSNLKRWLLGTHAGAVSDKHLQAYLDEFAFRYHRRKTKGVGRRDKGHLGWLSDPAGRNACEPQAGLETLFVVDADPAAYRGRQHGTGKQSTGVPPVLVRRGNGHGTLEGHCGSSGETRAGWSFGSNAGSAGGLNRADFFGGWLF